MNRSLLLGGAAAVATMTGCSSGSSDTGACAPAAQSGMPSGQPSGAPSGGPGGGMGGMGGTPTQQHIHTVIRTPNGNDYGVDLLKLHLESDH